MKSNRLGMVVYALFFWFCGLLVGIKLGWFEVGVFLSTLSLMAFSLAHACYALGWRNTFFFFVASAVITWSFEQVGVMTGMIYGAYTYSDLLGPKLGHVPVLIPCAWFMMFYPAYVIANGLVDGRAYGTTGGLGRVIWLSFVGAVVITAWDVIIDPSMAESGVWTWAQEGPYFGVPFQNYLGWIITSFCVYLAYRLWERKHWLGPSPAETVWGLRYLPLLVYAALVPGYMVGAKPVPLRLIVFFVMGFPVLLALGRLLDPKNGPD